MVWYAVCVCTDKLRSWFGGVDNQGDSYLGRSEGSQGNIRRLRYHSESRIEPDGSVEGYYYMEDQKDAQSAFNGDADRNRGSGAVGEVTTPYFLFNK